MHHPFVPLLVLAVGPLAYFAHRLGLLRYRGTRLAMAVCLVLVAVASLRAGGVDFLYLERMKLWIAAATVVLLVLHHGGAVGLADRRRYLAALSGIALCGWLVYLNFFSFHGERTYIHLHDVAHYYLGAKYFPELGYTGLYDAMLRAEAELYDDHFKAVEARDLATNQLVHIRRLLGRSDAVKSRFTAERWAAFQRDVGFFREATGQQYGEILRDHGFNATPVWLFVGTPLANLVPAGSHRGILVLTVLDPVLEAGTFVAVAWAFGAEAMLLCMIYFCVLYGASFGWAGGAYLRFMWFFALVGSVCCIRRRRYGAAGVLLGASSLLRIFPAFFLAGLVCKAGAEVVARRRLPTRYVRLLGVYGVTVVLLVAGTAALPEGARHWREFRANMQRHLQHTAYNTVGLEEIVGYRGPLSPVSPDAVEETHVHRRTLFRAVVAPMLALLAVFVAVQAPRRTDLEAAVMGVLLIFAGLRLASYYYVLLLALILVRRREPLRLAVIFAAEVGMYVLLLFEDREVTLYFYHNVLFLYLLIALYIEPLRAEAARVGRILIRR